MYLKSRESAIVLSITLLFVDVVIFASKKRCSLLFRVADVNLKVMKVNFGISLLYYILIAAANNNQRISKIDMAGWRRGRRLS
jgi:hypothetical protein